ncbi:MAG TPA: hypothetical protein VJI46_07200 [Candidatus Nanoarchaeia archaeon]|nr:hypothetical protein [Candidatus Nanoarchaeia archaeon]
MKLRNLIVATILIFILVGCAKQQPVGQPPQQVGEEGVEGVTEEQPPAEEEISAKEMTADAKAILAGISKITSYSFSNINGAVYLKGDRARIDLYQNRGRTGPEKYDTIYLDLKAKTAYGVCVDVDLCTYDMRKQYREVGYSEFDLGKLPIEYIKEIKYAEIDSSKTRTFKRANQQAKASLFKYKIGNVNYESWLDNFYGFPYELSMLEDDKQSTIEFKDVQINSVNDADVTLPPSLTSVK